jgi:hypothetical protein
VAVVSSSKTLEQLQRELQALEELLFLLSPERRKRLRPMLAELRREIAKAEASNVEENVRRSA